MSGAGRLAVAIDALPLVGSPTGVGVFCDQLIRSLANRSDLALTAFAVGWGAARARDRLPPSVTCRVTAVPARAVHASWLITGAPSAERLAGPASVVHGTNFVVPPARRAATVLTVHDMSPWRYPELCAPASRAYPALVRRAVLRGAFVHTPSQFVADEFVAAVGVHAERVRAIPHGLGRLDRPSDRYAAGANSPLRQLPYVLAIGTVEPRKGYPTLVAAFAELAAQRPDLQLVIAGSEGRGTRELDAAVASVGCGARILRLGYVDSATRASLLAGAAVLAYPSIYEGFGLPPLEAMAAGVPVVATAGGAIPEVVGDGAVVVPVGDAAALASALGQVVDDEQLRRELVARGRVRAARYSWESAADAMVALYADAAADRARGR